MFSPFSGSPAGPSASNNAASDPLSLVASSVTQNSSILLIVAAIVVLLVLSMIPGARAALPGAQNNLAMPASFSASTVVLIVVGVVLLLVAAQYMGFNLSYWLSPQAYQTSKATAAVDANAPGVGGATKGGVLSDKQVFNIPGNHYSYEDARAMCKAYGAELATYDQIEQAYNLGADWCNYGWSAGQMALFPTQKMTFDKLQGIKGHENDCGRPGVNGGYMANPDLQFGVNCYGKKPAINARESDLLASASPFPQTQEDIAFQQKVDSYKSQINSILISPFSYGKWTQL